MYTNVQKSSIPLSEAIMLGDMLKRPDPNVFVARRDDGEVYGCGLGGALLAVGVETTDEDAARTALGAAWPWLSQTWIHTFSEMYRAGVASGRGIGPLVEEVEKVERELWVAPDRGKFEVIEPVAV